MSRDACTCAHAFHGGACQSQGCHCETYSPWRPLMPEIHAQADKARFVAIQAAYAKILDRRERHERAMLEKYGNRRPPGHWTTRGEYAKRQAISAAEGRCIERMCTLLNRIGCRNWRSGVPAWWLVSELTYGDAVTRREMSVIPPCAYGRTPTMMREFAREIPQD